MNSLYQFVSVYHHLQWMLPAVKVSLTKGASFSPGVAHTATKRVTLCVTPGQLGDCGAEILPIEMSEVCNVVSM